MAKVILICGKICSGKTYYARQLQANNRAVIFSTDEATKDLIDNEQGEFYNAFAARVNRYLMKKAAQTALAGAEVILDWGFWSKKDRTEASSYLKDRGVPYEWHYVAVNDNTWYKNIEERNNKVKAGKGGSDFYVDDGLLGKLLSLFEEPEEDEINIRYDANR